MLPTMLCAKSVSTAWSFCNCRISAQRSPQLGFGTLKFLASAKHKVLTAWTTQHYHGKISNRARSNTCASNGCESPLKPLPTNTRAYKRSMLHETFTPCVQRAKTTQCYTTKLFWILRLWTGQGHMSAWSFNDLWLEDLRTTRAEGMEEADVLHPPLGQRTRF